MQANEKLLMRSGASGDARRLAWNTLRRLVLRPLAGGWRQTLRWVALHDPSPCRLAVLQASDVHALNRSAPMALGRDYRREFEDQQRGVQTVLVVWKGRRPIATGFIHWPGPRYDAVRAVYPGCPEIFRLHVRSSYRRLGWGARLIDAFETLARERQHTHVGLGVAYANMHAAHLYQRLGYQQPRQSDFIDEFDTLDDAGQRHHHQTHAHFLVKAL